MKKILSLLLISLPFLCFTQKIILGDSLSVEIKEVDIMKPIIVEIDEATKKTKSVRGINLRIFCQLKSLNGQSIDINAFSLIDTEKKLRFRLVNYRGWKGTSTIGFGHDNKSYLKKEILNSKGKRFRLIPKFDPSIEDSFGEFKFEGYKNIEIPRYFTSLNKNLTNVILSRKRNINSVVYYPHSKFKTVLAEFTFPCTDIESSGNYELYYGETFVSKLIFSK